MSAQGSSHDLSELLRVAHPALQDPYEVAEQLIEMWRNFDVDGYKLFLSTVTDWQYVSLILTQMIVRHPSDELMRRADIEQLREIWEASK